MLNPSPEGSVNQIKKLRPFVLVALIIAGVLIIGPLVYLAVKPNNPKAPKIITTEAINSSTDSAIPNIKTNVVLTGLDHPWDMAFLPDKSIIYTERGGGLSLFKDNKITSVFKPEDLLQKFEGGMLGMTLDPNFSSSRYVFLCMLSKQNNATEVRVLRLKLKSDNLSVEERKDIVTGLPVNTIGELGRHSGCRPRFGPDDYLWIGTGDSAMSNVAQDPKNLGGKVLRVMRDGTAAQDNLGAPFDPRIYSYGHRNIQGLAFWPANTAGIASPGFSVEHGSDRDDEVNELKKGNFGWEPIPAPYNEKVSMTDQAKFPDAISASWSSGSPTIAPSGATFVIGQKWKAFDGALFMAVLKGSQVRVFTFDADKKITANFVILSQFGRVRSVIQGPDGFLYLTTDNGQKQDMIVRASPE